jgi:hypothetical protein
MITAALTRYWSSDQESSPRDLLSLGQPNVPTLSPLYPIGRGEGLERLNQDTEREEEE